MRALVLLLACLLLPAAAAPPLETGPVLLCPPDEPPRSCAPVALETLDMDRPEAVLVRAVRVRPEALDRPLMVFVTAMASSEVRWNGTVIGRNGVPGADSASERPGRFVATFTVPPRLVRPGENQVALRLSAHHLWLPVRRTVHVFEVAPYQDRALPGLADYLPALLMLGALGAAFLYFFAAALGDRRDKGARLLALAAGSASLQLLAEVGRTFVAYSYPWHLVRVAAIALLAAVTAVALAAYAGRRLAPGAARRVTLATAAAAAASLLLVPWYDLKALGAILAGAAAIGFCAVRALGSGRKAEAWGALAAAGAFPALIAWQSTDFLDGAYYWLMAALLVALTAEQVSSLRRMRAERDAERGRAAALAERLSRAEREGEPIVALKEGSRTHRVAVADILYVQAADDYCEAALVGGRRLLVTTNMARLLGTLPPPFVRVHKSYAVNRAHVTSAAPRPGGGRQLVLSDGSAIPVGRSYGDALTGWLD